MKKQYEPIGFGDPYNPRSVEGHQNALIEAREIRDHTKRAKELDAEREANKPLTEKLADWLRSRLRR